MSSLSSPVAECCGGTWPPITVRGVVRDDGRYEHSCGATLILWNGQWRMYDATECTAEDCRKPVAAHGLCRSHYDRMRGKGRKRGEDAILRARARNRASARLVELHKEEFKQLYEQAKLDVQAETEELAKAAGVDVEQVRLRPGPIGNGQTRVRRLKVPTDGFEPPTSRS